jgi:hypothetical protein
MTNSSTTWPHLLRLLAIAWDPGAPPPPEPVPWPAVAALAREQDVAHLLYLPACRLTTALPPAVYQDLREAYLRSAALNSLRYRELERIQLLFMDLGVPTLLLKGAALAVTLYRNLALRPMGDLDLAVPHDRVPDCRRALIALAYRPTEIEERPGSHRAHRSEQVYMPPPPFRSPVAVHWQPFDFPYYLHRLPAEWFWNNTGLSEINGLPVQLLSAPANLLYLSAHLALHHRFHGLQWHVDLAWLIHANRSSLDWQHIASQAQEFELALALRTALDRLAGLWPSLELDVPRRLLASIQPAPGEQRIFRLLTAEPRTSFLDFASDIAGLPSSAARLRFVLANTFPQGPYMRSRYPVHHRWQLPVWYAYRLGDGAVKTLRTLWQLATLRSQ